MNAMDRDEAPRRDDDVRGTPAVEPAPPETAEHPAPDIVHRPEPDAENIVPVKHEPGTL
jgi:hypothetical protein